MALSSDCGAGALSPIMKIQTVLTRPDGRSFQNLETIIPLMTINPATLLQQDDKTGPAEVGKAADLVVLDKDIFEAPVEDTRTTQVLVTMLQGEAVYDPERMMGEAIGALASTSGSTSAGCSSQWASLLGALLLVTNIVVIR